MAFISWIFFLGLLHYLSICQYICGTRWALSMYMDHRGLAWLKGNVSSGCGGAWKSNSARMHSPGLRVKKATERAPS